MQTLRYYERRGLLPEPHRSLGGQREYDPEAVTALRANGAEAVTAGGRARRAR